MFGKGESSVLPLKLNPLEFPFRGQFLQPPSPTGDKLAETPKGEKEASVTPAAVFARPNRPFLSPHR